MLSNDEMKARIKELDPEAETKGLKSKDLATLLSDLKAEAEKPWCVSGGKSLTTKRGILSEGDEIKASDLPGGQDALDAWVEKGFVSK